MSMHTLLVIFVLAAIGFMFESLRDDHLLHSDASDDTRIVSPQHHNNNNNTNPPISLPPIDYEDPIAIVIPDSPYAASLHPTWGAEPSQHMLTQQSQSPEFSITPTSNNDIHPQDIDSWFESLLPRQKTLVKVSGHFVQNVRLCTLLTKTCKRTTHMQGGCFLVLFMKECIVHHSALT